jgi:dolichol-phosphate mannosyltransferase
MRYLAPYDHVQPVWFYLPGLFLGMLPWTLLLPPLARFLSRRPAAWAARRPPALGFFLLAFVVCVAFFSLSACKRSGYILPAFPLLALALGCYLDAVLPRPALGATSDAGYAVLLRSPGQLAWLATVLVLALGCAGSLAAVAAGLWRPAPGLVLAGLTAGGCGWLVRPGGSRPRASSWALCGATTFALLFVGIHQILPGYARKFSLRSQVQRHLPLVEDARISVYCYPHRWDSVSFYLNRGDVGVITPERRRQMIGALQKKPDCLVFVKSDGDDQKPLRDLLQALPPALEFVPCGRPGTVTAGLIRRKPSVPEFLVVRATASPKGGVPEPSAPEAPRNDCKNGAAAAARGAKGGAPSRGDRNGLRPPRLAGVISGHSRPLVRSGPSPGSREITGPNGLPQTYR